MTYVSQVILRRFLVGVIGFSALFNSSHAIAAERVVLKYGILRESVSVQELSAFAETGKLSPALQSYLEMAGKSPEQVRKPLNQEVTVSPILLDRVLNNRAGEFLLDPIGQAIHPPGNQASRQALRSALVLSATPDSRISLIEILQKYPTDEVEVDGDRLADVYRRIANLVSRLPR